MDVTSLQFVTLNVLTLDSDTSTLVNRGQLLIEYVSIFSQASILISVKNSIPSTCNDLIVEPSAIIVSKLLFVGKIIEVNLV